MIWRLGRVLACCALLAASSLSQTRLAAPVAQTRVQFVDVTEQLGIHFRHMASPTKQKYLLEPVAPGVALFDCDNDGRLDLLLVNSARIQDPMPKGAMPEKTGPEYWTRLYHQKPDGTFEDMSERAGVTGSGYQIGVAVGDYDNDGNEDLYVTGYPRNTLYHNEGNCTFKDVTDIAGAAAGGYSSSAAFVDLDNDGRLDLVVDRYLDWSFEGNKFCGERDSYRAYCLMDVYPGTNLTVYHNGGNGRFTAVTKAAGMFNTEGKALGVAVADYDRDGRIDVAIANDSVREFLFHNLGSGRFEEVGIPAGAAVDEDGHTYAGMGIDFADYDNDGWPDIIVTDLSNQRYALYRNERDGTFSYATQRTGVGRITFAYSGWGVKFFDFDNDGWKDLIVAQGHVLDTIENSAPQLRYLQLPLLLRNVKGRFEDVSASSGAVFRQPWAGRGLAVGDLDNDGDLDVVIATNNGEVHVLRNDGGNAGHWLQLRLVGRRSNRDAISAVVHVTAPNGSSQWATVTTSGSYLSASDRRLHFGLADQTQVSVEIRWPAGGVQKLNNVRSNQLLVVQEP
jgi:enediyne biosynthesis protein E4